VILITGDIHLNDQVRDQYRHDWMRNILPSLLRKHRAELLVVLGDCSDDKDHLSSWLVNQTVDHFTALANICPVIVLKGNHDYVVADNPFFEFLGKIEGITWVSTPKIAAELEIPKLSALFLPHTTNYQRDWKSLNFDAHSLIFAHQTFAGAAVGPRKLDGIPTDIFPNGVKVVSGDIHQPQSFGPITYVGAPYLEDFGDLFDPRVLLIDGTIFKPQLTSIQSPGPQKRLVEIVWPNRKIERPWTDYIKTKAQAGDILKVRIEIEPAQTPQWQSIKDEVRRWADQQGYHVHLIQPKVNTAGTKSMAKRKVGSKSDDELLEVYATARAVSEATLTTGKKLMEKI
jgi:hypothetical protein